MILGDNFSSLASDLYSRAAEVPDLMRTVTKMTTTPKPPIHCSRLLKNKIEYGRISTSAKRVSPLPVHADMFSKNASMNGAFT